MRALFRICSFHSRKTRPHLCQPVSTVLGVMGLDTELLGNVIEFSIGLAGFSGVIAVFAGRADDRIRIDLFRLRNLMLGAFAPAFISFATLGFHRALPDTELAWTASLLVSSSSLGGYLFHAIWSRGQMPEQLRRELQNLVFFIITSAMFVILLMQIAVLFGATLMTRFDVLYLGLVFILFVSTYQFIRAVLEGVRSNAQRTSTPGDVRDDA